MELREIFTPLIRWWWLILTATVVAALSSLVTTIGQPPTYETQATLMIGTTFNDPNPTSGEINLAVQLAEIYADIANREPVRNATMEALGITWLPDYQAVSLPDSQLILINVQDSNAARAQAVANELANQVILRSPGNTTDVERARFISDQLDRIQSQIGETQADIETLQASLSTLNSARQIADTQNQINNLQTVLTSLRANYASLLNNTQAGAINTITVIEPANLPRRPIPSSSLMTVLLSAAVGFTLAALAAYGLEFLDDTLKTSDEITRLTRVNVIGQIGDMGSEKENAFYVARNPRSPIADAFRSMRINLEYAAVDKPLRTILVSSSSSDEGKSTMAFNIALSIAQADRRVILVDADMRRPVLHAAIGMSNPKGLSDVFRGRLTLREALVPLEDARIQVLPSGPLPPNPTELLASQRMNQILNGLRELADVVIIDGPPFVVPDASVLSDKVDGVLLVVRQRFSRRGPVQMMLEQAKRISANVVGIIINQSDLSHAYYSSYYYTKGAFANGNSGDGATDKPEKSGSPNWLQRLTGMIQRK